MPPAVGLKSSNSNIISNSIPYPLIHVAIATEILAVIMTTMQLVQPLPRALCLPDDCQMFVVVLPERTLNSGDHVLTHVAIDRMRNGTPTHLLLSTILSA
jgi:hypothetical protein